jgi:hypothetical protein
MRMELRSMQCRRLHLRAQPYPPPAVCRTKGMILNIMRMLSTLMGMPTC